MGGRGRRRFSTLPAFAGGTPGAGIITGNTSSTATGGGGGGVETDAGNKPYVTSGATYNDTGSAKDVPNGLFKDAGNDAKHLHLVNLYKNQNLSVDERTSLSNYAANTSTSSAYSNFASGKNSNSNYKKHVENIDRVGGQIALDRNMVLHRGISGGGKGQQFADKIAVKGAVFTDTRFTSMSTSFNTAKGFDGNTIIRYHLPKGTRGTYLAGKGLPHSGEREFIMSRFTTFKTLKVETTPSGRRIIDVRVFPN